jgi:hypothetical protein
VPSFVASSCFLVDGFDLEDINLCVKLSFDDLPMFNFASKYIFYISLSCKSTLEWGDDDIL